MHPHPDDDRLIREVLDERGRQHRERRRAPRRCSRSGSSPRSSIRSRTSRTRSRSGAACSRSCSGRSSWSWSRPGGGMMSQAFPNTISRAAAVIAPGLMVMAIILFMGKVSGAHLNPAVSLAFAARGDFPWRRVPGYIVVQLGGRDAGRAVPARRHRRLGHVRLQLPGAGLLGHGRVLDGVHPHPRAGQRHPRHRLGCAEHRDRRRVRGRRLHRAGRPVGQPDLGHVDEPGPHLRPRPRRAGLDRLLGLRRRPDRRRGRWRSSSGSCCAAAAAGRPDPAPPRARSTPRSASPARTEPCSNSPSTATPVPGPCAGRLYRHRSVDLVHRGFAAVAAAGDATRLEDVVAVGRAQREPDVLLHRAAAATVAAAWRTPTSICSMSATTLCSDALRGLVQDQHPRAW